MARPPERNYAPYCDHAFTVVNVRGAYHTALDIVEDLRAAHDGDYYVSDPYDLSGAWVFALCSGCKRSVGQRRASVLDRRRAEKTVLKTPCNALTGC